MKGLKAISISRSAGVVGFFRQLLIRTYCKKKNSNCTSDVGHTYAIANLARWRHPNGAKLFRILPLRGRRTACWLRTRNSRFRISSRVSVELATGYREFPAKVARSSCASFLLLLFLILSLLYFAVCPDFLQIPFLHHLPTFILL